MIRVQKSGERGHANWGWLDTRHSFSFGDYHNPQMMGYRSLRVINEDLVEPGQGFGTHPHKNMEILSWVVDGAMEHKDSMGTGSVIRPGDLQRMSAGMGITHSEFNPSEKERLHLVQIWLLPERQGLTPEYEQMNFPESERRGGLKLIASNDGRAGSVTIHQDADLYNTILAPGESVTLPLRAGRAAWVQVLKGRLTVNGHELLAGDGAALEDEASVALAALEVSEALVFDLN
jgi:hypothetical protein